LSRMPCAEVSDPAAGGGEGVPRRMVCIDAGTRTSGFVVLGLREGVLPDVLESSKEMPNADLLVLLESDRFAAAAIERMRGRGLPTG